MERQPIPSPQPRFQVYLVRLWRDNATATWRVSVQRPTDPAPLGFADLDSFIDYLRDVTASPPPTDARLDRARAPPPIRRPVGRLCIRRDQIVNCTGHHHARAWDGDGGAIIATWAAAGPGAHAQGGEPYDPTPITRLPLYGLICMEETPWLPKLHD